MNLTRLNFFKYIVVILLFFYSTVTVYSIENIKSVDKIKVYYVDWNIMTRKGLTVHDVKKMRHFYLEINYYSKINNIVREVNNIECENMVKRKIGDVRFVLDIIKDSIIIFTVAANNDYVQINDSYVCKNNKKLMKLFNVF